MKKHERGSKKQMTIPADNSKGQNTKTNQNDKRVKKNKRKGFEEKFHLAILRDKVRGKKNA